MTSADEQAKLIDGVLAGVPSLNDEQRVELRARLATSLRDGRRREQVLRQLVPLALDAWSTAEAAEDEPARKAALKWLGGIMISLRQAQEQLAP